MKPWLVVIAALAGCGKSSSATSDGGGDDAPAVGDAHPDSAPGDSILADSASADACVTTCGTATCGDDGCGGMCGPACPGTEYCGGGGVPGQCGMGAIGAYPGVTPIEIDSGAVKGLRVANDEHHVMLQRTESASFTQGALAVVTIDSAGHGTAIALTTAVDFTNGVPRAEFTADSSALYFVDGSATARKLTTTAADGSSPRVLATGTIQTSEVQGKTLVYTVASPSNDGNNSVFAAVLPSGAIVPLASGMRYAIRVASTGSAIFLTDEGGSALHELVQTATGAATPLGTTGTAVQGVWSPDGAHLAYWFGLSTATVHVIDADGTHDVVLTTSGPTGFAPMFSPDGALLAYASSGTAMTVRNLAAGTSAVLTVGASQLLYVPNRFSPDGKELAVTTFDSQLGIAATDHGAPFSDVAALVANLPVDPCEWSAAHDFVAALIKNRALTVVPAAGGAAHSPAIPIDQPAFYEPVATQPHLLAFTSTGVAQSGIPGSVAVLAPDGTGAAALVPGTVLPAFTQSQLYHSPQPGWQGADGGSGQIAEPFTWGWLGSEIVYESDRDGQNPWFDVIAATDTVGTVGVIAPGANVWAVRDQGLPTRVVFSRAATGGTWWSPLPQTPGH